MESNIKLLVFQRNNMTTKPYVIYVLKLKANSLLTCSLDS